MRIALIAEDFRAIGGIQELVDNLAVQFVARGHQVTIASTAHITAGCERAPRFTNNLFFADLPGRKALNWRHPERLFKQQPRAVELGDYLSAWRPDVVNSHLWTWDKLITVADECDRRGFCFVQSLHDSWGKGKLGNRALSALKQASALVALSSATRDFFVAQTQAASRALVVLGGVDVEAAVAAQPADMGDPYVFCAASLNLRFKAVDVVIEAFAQLAADYPDLNLVLAGDGPDRVFLQERARKLSAADKIKFLGVVPRERLWSLYKGAQVFAMPSHQPEGLGLVFLEAMACGTPAIGSRSGGTPEIIDHGRTGFLLDQNDAVELSDRIRSILIDPLRRAAMSQAAAAKVAQSHSWNAVADRYLSVYTRCIEAGRV